MATLFDYLRNGRLPRRRPLPITVAALPPPIFPVFCGPSSWSPGSWSCAFRRPLYRLVVRYCFAAAAWLLSIVPGVGCPAALLYPLSQLPTKKPSIILISVTAIQGEALDDVGSEEANWDNTS